MRCYSVAGFSVLSELLSCMNNGEAAITSIWQLQPCAWTHMLTVSHSEMDWLQTYSNHKCLLSV